MQGLPRRCADLRGEDRVQSLGPYSRAIHQDLGPYSRAMKQRQPRALQQGYDLGFRV